MIISVTSAHIASAGRGTLGCPLAMALWAMGVEIGMVSVGTDGLGIDKGKLVGKAYLTVAGEPVIQPLPGPVCEMVRLYDKTGEMHPFTFELPDL